MGRLDIADYRDELPGHVHHELRDHQQREHHVVVERQVALDRDSI